MAFIMNVYFFCQETWRRPGKDSGIWRLSALVMISIIMCWPSPGCSDDHLQQRFGLSSLLKTRVPIASVDVKNSYPHDPGAFTQGLFFHQDDLYESTGLNGKSTLVRKNVQTGKILRAVKLPREYFAEGIALLNGKIYQLTWRNQIAMIYDAGSFQTIGQLKYQGEGWGLTSDGRYLLMSNGSPEITFRDPDSFRVVRKIKVHDGDTPVEYLNELEYIKGEIWANVFTQDIVARISPKDGRVIGWIDLSLLRAYLPRHANVDVLNGIAYDEERRRIFVTGKYWPKIFEIQLSGLPVIKP